MPDHTTILLPADPFHRPDETQLQKAADWLGNGAAPGSRVETRHDTGPQFYDCGQNFAAITCPSCAAPVSLDWWGDRMTGDFDGEIFRLQMLAMPCCPGSHTLNDLSYDATQGFGAAAVLGHNLGAGLLEAEDIATLEQILGCAIRVIYRHA